MVARCCLNRPRLLCAMRRVTRHRPALPPRHLLAPALQWVVAAEDPADALRRSAIGCGSSSWTSGGGTRSRSSSSSKSGSSTNARASMASRRVPRVAPCRRRRRPWDCRRPPHSSLFPPRPRRMWHRSHHSRHPHRPRCSERGLLLLRRCGCLRRGATRCRRRPLPPEANRLGTAGEPPLPGKARLQGLSRHGMRQETVPPLVISAGRRGTTWLLSRLPTPSVALRPVMPALALVPPPRWIPAHPARPRSGRGCWSSRWTPRSNMRP